MAFRNPILRPCHTYGSRVARGSPHGGDICYAQPPAPARPASQLELWLIGAGTLLLALFLGWMAWSAAVAAAPVIPVAPVHSPPPPSYREDENDDAGRSGSGGENKDGDGDGNAISHTTLGTKSSEDSRRPQHHDHDQNQNQNQTPGEDGAAAPRPAGAAAAARRLLRAARSSAGALLLGAARRASAADVAMEAVAPRPRPIDVEEGLWGDSYSPSSRSPPGGARGRENDDNAISTGAERADGDEDEDEDEDGGPFLRRGRAGGEGGEEGACPP